MTAATVNAEQDTPTVDIYKDDSVDENSDKTTDSVATSDPAITDIISTKDAIVSESTSESATSETIKLAAASGNSITVSTFAELKKYMEDGANGYTEFYLSADIVATSGINVASTKKDILISGKNPETGQSHSYKELPSLAQTQTILVGAGTNITVEYMDIDAYNYYGTVSTYDGTQNVYIKYNNVNYNGPQIGFNLNGTIHIKDSNILIPQTTKPSGSPNQEIAQASKVILEGKTTLRKTGGSDATFWLYGRSGTAELRVLSGSDVFIEGISYFIYQSVSGTEINIEDDGKLNAVINGGLSYVGQVLGSINIDHNGEFKYTHDGTKGSLRTMTLNGNISVGNGATFDVRRTQGSYNTTANSKILLSMENASSQIIFNNPKQVILVNAMNSTDGLIRFSAGGTLNINTPVMNLWNNIPSGFSSDIQWQDPLGDWQTEELPKEIWNQNDFASIGLSATYKSNSPVASPTISQLTDYVPSTTKNSQTISSTNFLGADSKMFTAGTSMLEFDGIYDSMRKISGKSPAGSHVNIMDTGDTIIDGSAIANSEGVFSISVDEELVAGATIIGTNQHNFLRGYASTTVLHEDGILKFATVPTTLSFDGNYTPNAFNILERMNEDWTIEIEDTRKSSSDWAVYASIEAPLSVTHNEDIFSLPNGLIFNDGDTMRIFSADPILISKGTTSSSSTDGITSLNWPNNEGPLIRLDEDDYVISGTKYSTIIKWTLVSAPE